VGLLSTLLANEIEGKILILKNIVIFRWRTIIIVIEEEEIHHHQPVTGIFTERQGGRREMGKKWWCSVEMNLEIHLLVVGLGLGRWDGLLLQLTSKQNANEMRWMEWVGERESYSYRQYLLVHNAHRYTESLIIG